MKSNFSIKKIKKSGVTSHSLVIPIEIIREFGLKEDSQVCIYTDDDKIIIQTLDKIIDLDGVDNER
jgi:bifunctional DNA-binding transcriptional regulator/antitoxin component of YhaV-PrlF toxin-antitoxin module